MRCLVAAAVLFAVIPSLAMADPVEERQQLVKGVGAATKTGVGLAKGEIPFDAAKAEEVLQVYVNASEKLPTLFPDDSQTGHDTTASPKIWEDMAGFKARAAKLGEDAKAAIAGATDQAGFVKGFGMVTQNCNACHETYRIKNG
jgi:cytochrome c556